MSVCRSMLRTGYSVLLVLLCYTQTGCNCLVTAFCPTFQADLRAVLEFELARRAVLIIVHEECYLVVRLSPEPSFERNLWVCSFSSAADALTSVEWDEN